MLTQQAYKHVIVRTGARALRVTEHARGRRSHTSSFPGTRGEVVLLLSLQEEGCWAEGGLLLGLKKQP